MADVDAHEIRFQCPNFGHDLTQTIGRLKAQEHMACRIVASESISTPIDSQEPPKKFRRRSTKTRPRSRSGFSVSCPRLQPCIGFA
jgi:hypothetical protein